MSLFQGLVKRSTMKTFGLCEYHNTAFVLVLRCNVIVLIHILDTYVSRYEKSSRFMKDGYERDFLRYLQSLLAEVERRIRRGHARLALSQAQQNAGVGADSAHIGFATFCFSQSWLRSQSLRCLSSRALARQERMRRRRKSWQRRLKTWLYRWKIMKVTGYFESSKMSTKCNQ